MRKAATKNSSAKATSAAESSSVDKSSPKHQQTKQPGPKQPTSPPQKQQQPPQQKTAVTVNAANADDDSPLKMLGLDDGSDMAADFATMLGHSGEYSKYVKDTKPLSDDSTNPSSKQALLANDLFKLDLKKLNELIRCQPYHVNFMHDMEDATSLYLTEEHIKAFESKATAFLDDLNNRRVNIDDANGTIDAAKTTNTCQTQSSSNTAVTSKLVSILLSPSDETSTLSTPAKPIDDWLDELIID